MGYQLDGNFYKGLRPEGEWFKKVPPSPRSYVGESYGSPGKGKNDEKAAGATTFEALAKLKTTEKESQLFQIFNNLYSGQMSLFNNGHARLWEVYTGTDTEFKDELTKIFGDQQYVYNGMDLNSLVKSIATKVIQPFLSQDRIVSVQPLNIDIETADRVGELLNTQLTKGNFRQEVFKTLKDSLVYGIGFMSVGWTSKSMTVPKKRILKKRLQPGIGIDDEVEVFDQDVQTETVTMEMPDFKSEFVNHIYYPRAQRWEDLPYVLRKEIISKRVFNERYADSGIKFDELTAQQIQTSQYTLNHELDRLKIPATGALYGSSAIEQIEILHYYFRDGSYYVTVLLCGDAADGKSTYYANQLVYEGVSPVPGLPIPIIPLIPDPITNRIAGESAVAVSIFEQRKITELDNLAMYAARNQATSPLFYTDASGLDIAAYMARTPKMPIKIQDVNEVKEANFNKFDTTIPAYRESIYGNLQRLTGQSDFAQGNIGKSARLTGVDSLIGMAMSRLSVVMSQFNEFVLKIVDGMVLLNRAFLPKDYGYYSTSLYASELEEILDIPYPLCCRISTAISGGSDQSIRLGALREAVQLAFQVEASMPGTMDLIGLIQRFFHEAGLSEIGRYFKKSPLTKNERQVLSMLDATIAMQGSSLAGVPTAQSPSITGQMPEQMNGGSVSTGSDMGGQGFDPSGMGQAGQIGGINEQSGQSLYM